jgi:hypothetical protein
MRTCRITLRFGGSSRLAEFLGVSTPGPIGDKPEDVGAPSKCDVREACPRAQRELLCSPIVAVRYNRSKNP